MVNQSNYFAEMQEAVLNTSIRIHATNLVFKTQLKEKVTTFQDWQEWSSDGNCKGLTLPINWVIEYISSNEKGGIKITFGITPEV